MLRMSLVCVVPMHRKWQVSLEHGFEHLVLHRELDAIQDYSKRLELLLRGVFAGNIFDLGAATSADLFKSNGVGLLPFAALRLLVEVYCISAQWPLTVLSNNKCFKLI